MFVIVFDQLIIGRGSGQYESMWNSYELRSQESCKPTETCLINQSFCKNIIFNYFKFLDRIKLKSMKTVGITHAVILAENVKFSCKELSVRVILTQIKAATHF